MESRQVTNYLPDVQYLGGVADSSLHHDRGTAPSLSGVAVNGLFDIDSSERLDTLTKVTKMQAVTVKQVILFRGLLFLFQSLTSSGPWPIPSRRTVTINVPGTLGTWNAKAPTTYPLERPFSCRSANHCDMRVYPSLETHAIKANTPSQEHEIRKAVVIMTVDVRAQHAQTSFVG